MIPLKQFFIYFLLSIGTIEKLCAIKQLASDASQNLVTPTSKTSLNISNTSNPRLKDPQITKVNKSKLFTVIEINEIYSIPIKATDSVGIENKNNLIIKDNGHQLILQGKKEGVTLLKIGSNTYKLIVANKEQLKTFQNLKKLLQITPSLSLDFDNGFFLIEGRMDQVSTWLSLANLSLTNYKMRAEISQDQVKIVNYYINSQLVKKGFFPITLTLDPSPTVRLHPSAIKNHPISKFIESYGITIIEDKNQILAEPLIRVQVLLAEIRKSFAQSIGIEWPYEASAKIVPQGLLPTGNEPNFMAHFIATKGNGRILANPVLLAKSGSEAEFFAGGEFPIKTKTKQTQTIIWKKYGITLKIKPQVDYDGKLGLDLSSEISSIDSGEKIDGIPSLFTNTLSSHFDLHQSQTIALSGLIKKVNGEAIKQWPGWGEIPIIGSLFSSRDYQDDQTELAIFVTPSVDPTYE